jgi:nitrogen fixation NifU-like protein
MNDQDLIYHELILELNRHPLNKKQLSNFTYHYKEFNPLCGDEVELFIKTDKDDRIIDIGFLGNGCAISQASASILTEKIKNKKFSEVQNLENNELLGWLGLKNLNPTRIRCATLSLECLKKIF